MQVTAFPLLLGSKRNKFEITQTFERIALKIRFILCINRYILEIRS